MKPAAPGDVFAAFPCDEHGTPSTLAGPIVETAAEAEAEAALGPYNYGGLIRRTAPDGVEAWDYGGGYAPTPAEAVALWEAENPPDDCGREYQPPALAAPEAEA